MQSWWKRFAKLVSTAALPVDGDPGAWRSSSHGQRPGRPGARTVAGSPSRTIARGDTIERSVWRDVHLPPPAA